MASDMLSQAQMNAALTAQLGVYAGKVKVGLFKNAPNLSPKSATLTDFVEPTGSWYTQKALTYFNPTDDGVGNLQVDGAAVHWDYSGTDPSETIAGYFVVYQPAGGPPTPAPELVQARYLDSPKTLAAVLDGLTVEPSFTVPKVQAAQ